MVHGDLSDLARSWNAMQVPPKNPGPAPRPVPDPKPDHESRGAGAAPRATSEGRGCRPGCGLGLALSAGALASGYYGLFLAWAAQAGNVPNASELRSGSRLAFTVALACLTAIPILWRVVSGRRRNRGSSTRRPSDDEPMERE